MFKGKKIAIVMPAYNAEKTIVKTYREVVDQEIVDVIIIVDDKSRDKTPEVLKTLRADGVKTIIHRHEKNLGYGGNQKTCYQLALQTGVDIIVMVHPDYQYTPLLIPAMVGMIVNKVYPCVLASRILGKGAIRGGMPIWKYIINRVLTIMENTLLNSNLSEYHTGYRAYSRELLEDISFKHNSNGFIFDNEIIAQILYKRYPIGEISCPIRYAPEASVIHLGNAVRYGLGCFRVAFTYRLAKMKLIRSKLFT